MSYRDTRKKQCIFHLFLFSCQRNKKVISLYYLIYGWPLVYVYNISQYISKNFYWHLLSKMFGDLWLSWSTQVQGMEETRHFNQNMSKGLCPVACAYTCACTYTQHAFAHSHTHACIDTRHTYHTHIPRAHYTHTPSLPHTLIFHKHKLSHSHTHTHTYYTPKHMHAPFA